MYNNPYNPYSFNYSQFQQPQKTEVVRVNGKNGADTFQLAPNSSILLLDESAPIIWLKTSDGAGYCTTTPYKIEPYIEEKTDANETLKSLESRITALEEALNNVKSNASNVISESAK